MAKINDEAKAQAVSVLDGLVKEGRIDKEAAGNAVLIEMVASLLAKREDGNHLHSIRDRTAVANSVLPYLIQKPVSEQKVTVSTVDDFLMDLAKGDDAG